MSVRARPTWTPQVPTGREADRSPTPTRRATIKASFLRAMDAETAAIERLERVVGKGEKFLTTYVQGQTLTLGVMTTQHIAPTFDATLLAEFEAQAHTCLVDLLGEHHGYVGYLKTAQDLSSRDASVRQQVGVLRAVLDDVRNRQLLRTTRVLVAAELFTDFMEQADHLLAAGYHVAAASLCGAVLESDLREYAMNNGVPGLKQQDDISSLNQKCAQAGLYTVIDRKQVEVWAGVRNQADHGQFNAVTVQAVTDMLTGVRKFLRDTLRV